MATAPPSTAAVALVGFFSEISSALFLKRRLFDAAATDPSTWRRAGLVVILAGFASDSLGLYSDLDAFLVRFLANWSLVPIMLLGLARWLAGTAVAHTVCRIFGEDIPFEALMRCAGYAYAPALIQFVPGLVYWLDLMPVTLDMVWLIRWLSVAWLLSALTVAASVGRRIDPRPRHRGRDRSLRRGQPLRRRARHRPPRYGWNSRRAALAARRRTLECRTSPSPRYLPPPSSPFSAWADCCARSRSSFQAAAGGSSGGVLLWSVLYAAIAVPAVMSGEAAPIDVDELSLWSLFVGHAGLSAFLLCWWLLRRPIRLARFLRLEGTGPADLIGGVRLGFRVWMFTFGIAVTAGLILQLAIGAGESYTGTAIELPEIPDVMLWMVALPVYGKLLIVLVAMTVEEAFFRAFLQTAHRTAAVERAVRARPTPATALPTLMIGVFVVSIVIGRDFAKHQRLAPLHARARRLRRHPAPDRRALRGRPAATNAGARRLTPERTCTARPAPLLLDVEGELLPVGVDGDLAAVLKPPEEQLVGERFLDLPVDQARHRTRAEGVVVALLGEVADAPPGSA